MNRGSDYGVTKQPKKISGLLAAGSWCLLIPLVGLLYRPLNHNNGHVHMLITIIDQNIAFNRFFVVPYLAWYFIIFVALIWFISRDHKLYYSTLISIICGLLISFGLFSIFQTTVPRPVVMGSDLFSQLTKLVYRIDSPYNAFPSIHVMTSFIIFLGCNRTRVTARRTSLFFQGTAILVMLSTLFIKQHTLADVAGGLIMGFIMFRAADILVSSNYGPRLSMVFSNVYNVLFNWE